MELADAELIAEFAIESQEGLANIEQQMLAIEADGAEINVDLVNAVFRTMHSIKGTAGFLGWIGLARSRMVSKKFSTGCGTAKSFQVLSCEYDLARLGLHEGLIEAVESSNDADITPYVESLQQFRTGQAAEEKSVVAAPTQPTPLQANASTSVLNDAAREFIAECQENLDLMDRDLMTLEQNPTATNLLRGIFRTMHTIKGGQDF